MRDWIYPSIVFVLFIYVVIFIIVYAYKASGDVSYTIKSIRDTTMDATMVESFKEEVLKNLGF